MYPGDKSGILSTLEFFCELVEKQGITPVIPLYWKAEEIIACAQPDIRVRYVELMLGSFQYRDEFTWSHWNTHGWVWSDKHTRESICREFSCTRTEEQRALWILSAPTLAEYQSSMQEFVNVAYSACEQHKESGKARIERDSLEFLNMITKVRACDLFGDEEVLRNVYSGIVATQDTNDHEFQHVGRDMADQPAFSMKFKRSSKAITLGSERLLKIS